MPEETEETAPPSPATATPAPIQAGRPSPGARHFNCLNCGSSLLYQPGSDFIVCPYCQTRNPIPAAENEADYLKENDFLLTLEEEERKIAAQPEGPTLQTVTCPACGANTTVSEEHSADRCPYCGSPLSIQNRQSVKLPVQAVLPFQLDRQKALAVYQAWIASRWFAPGDFVRRSYRNEGLDGVYLPYWTFDADTITNYRGERGDAYYETRVRRMMLNGKMETRTEQVRLIRWTPVRGKVSVAFDDILITASTSLPGVLVNRLEPWDLSGLKPFQNEYLSGFVTNTYNVSLRDGFVTAQVRMEPVIEHAVLGDIGGDEQRIGDQDTRYNHVTFKHILLPVWLSAYAYGNRTYRFVINAQTGEVQGERPWSVWKIALTIITGLAAAGGLIYWLVQSGFFA
ncbi:MAG: zinc ribbon domain-containing protein [Planctomycetota bacterium]|jgi:LSD1 subclass zinc finger protein|nr:zinc ribbon domain-containing protein [Planctomycetota bacterium]